MTKFNIGLFLLAISAYFANAERRLPSLLPDDAVQRDLAVAGWNEGLGMCSGATCGMWGDPHMITCDGVGFDCQGVGTFNLMENHLYKIQGRFLPVGVYEQGRIEDWGLTEGASLTNDIVVQMKDPVVNAPLIQFGFGHLPRHGGSFVSEQGCMEGKYYQPTDMPGQQRTWEPSLHDCQERCSNVPGSTKFSYWADGACHCNSDAETIRDAPLNWPRALAGPVDECGADPTPEELDDLEERSKHGMIGNQCPLIMHVDGEMIDISGVGNFEFYLGDDNSPIQVQNIHNIAIMLRYALPDGSFAEVHLVARGYGPGELWSCHFDFWVCLPRTQQQEFLDTSKGLMGSPDGFGQNDFIGRDGNYVGLKWDTNWHKTFINYCYENHCTEQDENIMTPPNGKTFEDIKCEHVSYEPFDLNDPICVLTPEQMQAECDDVPYLLTNACLFECCMGGCGEMPEVVEEIEETVKLSDEEEDNLYEEPVQSEPVCVDGEMNDTSDTVCPSFDGEIVKLLSSTGPPPPDDVFFGIKMDSGGDVEGRTLRFMVNNPFDVDSKVYIKYGKSVFGHAFMDPKCDGFEVPTGCNEDAAEIEVACHDYEDVEPFALVQVYFASSAVEGTTDIDECCPADVGAGEGVVMYSFEIACACPDNALDSRR